MIREWRHLKMGKQAGRGHDPSGIDATSQGALAVPCRACPLPEVNLPEDWRSLPDNSQYVV